MNVNSLLSSTFSEIDKSINIYIYVTKQLKSVFHHRPSLNATRNKVTKKLTFLLAGGFLETAMLLMVQAQP